MVTHIKETQIGLHASLYQIFLENLETGFILHFHRIEFNFNIIVFEYYYKYLTPHSSRLHISSHIHSLCHLSILHAALWHQTSSLLDSQPPVCQALPILFPKFLLHGHLHALSQVEKFSYS